MVPAPRRRWLRRSAILVPIVIGLAAVLAREIGIGVVIAAPNRGRRIDPAEDAGPGELHALGVDAAFRVETGAPPESISVWVFDPAASPAGTVLVLHGIRDEKRSMIGVADRLTAAGFRAVLVDLRGHGRSSGEQLSYGIRESADLSAVIDALAARGGSNGLAGDRVGVYGVSYGAATALQLAGRDPRVVAVVAVAPFSSLREVAPCYADRFLGPIVPRALVDWFVDEAGARAGFDPDDASPLAAIRRTEAAVLLVHGRDDRNIPWQHSDALHRAAPDRSRLLVIDGADHDTITLDATGVIARDTAAFWTTHLAPRSAASR